MIFFFSAHPSKHVLYILNVRVTNIEQKILRILLYKFVAFFGKLLRWEKVHNMVQEMKIKVCVKQNSFIYLWDNVLILFQIIGQIFLKNQTMILFGSEGEFWIQNLFWQIPRSRVLARQRLCKLTIIVKHNEKRYENVEIRHSFWKMIFGRKIFYFSKTFSYFLSSCNTIKR